MLLVIVIVIIVGFLFWKVEGFSLRWAQPNKVFSSETSNGINDANMHLAFPSKCFSCSKDLIRRGLDPMYGGRTKCFSCEANFFFCYFF